MTMSRLGGAQCNEEQLDILSLSLSFSPGTGAPPGGLWGTRGEHLWNTQWASRLLQP